MRPKYSNPFVIPALALTAFATIAHGGAVIPITNGYFDTTGTPPDSWADVDGTPTVRTFNASGQRMISTNGTGAFQARQTTSTAAANNTTYLLEFDQGFATSATTNDDYKVQIGTDAGGFTSLGSKSGTVTSTSGSANFGSDNSHYNSFQITTGGSASGNLAVQLEISANNSWLGYDNVHLTAFAANEIVIANHSFDMTSRDNQGAGVGGSNNLSGWSEITTATARGFTGGASRALIGQGISDAFTAEQVLGTAIQANTEYTLTVDIGFMQSTSGVNGDYVIQLGTSNGGVFSMLAELDSSLLQTVTSEYFFTNGNGVPVDVLLTTGATVSGDDLAIRLTKEDTTTFFGFDQVALTAVTVPEPAAALLGGLGLLTLLRRRRRG